MNCSARYWVMTVIVGGALTATGCKARVHPIYHTTPVKVSSEQIYKDFQNETEANKKYLGKLVEVDGMADRTGMDPTGQFYVLMKGGDAIGTVICYFPKKMKDLSAEIKPGQPLVLRGIVLNRLMNVVIDECVVVKG